MRAQGIVRKDEGLGTDDDILITIRTQNLGSLFDRLNQFLGIIGIFFVVTLLDPMAPRDIRRRVRPVSFPLQNLDAPLQRLAPEAKPLVLTLQAVNPRGQCDGLFSSRRWSMSLFRSASERFTVERTVPPGRSREALALRFLAEFAFAFIESWVDCLAIFVLAIFVLDLLASQRAPKRRTTTTRTATSGVSYERRSSMFT